MTVNFNNGANFAEGQALLTRTVQEILNTTQSQVGLEDQMSKLGFVMQGDIWTDGIITSMVGPEELDELAEDGVAAVAVVLQGFEKRYKLKEYALAHKCTKLLSKWLENGAIFEGADSSVKQELLKWRDNMENLIAGNTLTRNRVMTEVFANGFAATTTSPAYGPGSVLGDGQLLFSAAHIVKKTGATFSNLLASALTAVSLEAAIQQYKTTIYSPNGYRIKTPDVFDLIVPRALETAARKILNSSGEQAGIYAGTANNANLLNVFSFQGSKVRLVVLDMLGENRKDGTKIGGANADSMWFLANGEYNTRYKSFRLISMWDKEVYMWKDDATQALWTQICTYFTADAYNAEGILGYPGA